MKYKNITGRSFQVLALVVLFAASMAAQATAFTYQGKLTNNGTPATGTFEMRFTLYDLPAGGFEFGTPKIIPNIVVTNGIFTVVITTGDWSFDQNDRYIEIAVRPQGSVDPFTALAPLQRITHTPKAIFANTAALAGFSASAGNAANLAGLGIEQFVLKNVNGEIVAPRLENLAADPAPASVANKGRVYFNTTKNNLMVSNGTEWVNISMPRVQRFTGNPGISSVQCLPGFPGAIRTVTFTKSLATSRLRINYRDTASANYTSSEFLLAVYIYIDNTQVTNPTSWGVTFRAIQTLQPNLGSRVDSGFTTVGYIDGVTAGTHTLTPSYFTGSEGLNCERTGAYFIEIEEVP